MSLISFLFRRFSSIEKVLETGTVRTVKNNIVSIEGMNGVKKGDIVKVGEYNAWVFALYEEHSLAAILNEKSVNYSGTATMAAENDWFIDVSADCSVKNRVFKQNGYSFKQFLNTKPPLAHQVYSQQLLSGYMQLDICQPLSLGQFALFCGKSNTGKTKLAYQIAANFAKQPGKKVVIASPNPIKSKIPLENAVLYTSDPESSEIYQYLLPFAALAHACMLRDQGHDVLFVLDDILFHSIKEKSVFFPEKMVRVIKIDTNIGSLIFEHSKKIKENSSLTSILIQDEDVTDENYRLFTQGLNTHLKSLVSQVYNFHSDHPELSQTKPTLNFIQPKFTEYSYQLPIFSLLRNRLMQIFKDLKDQQDIEKIKKNYGFKSDPWDMYLLLDSKYYLNLLCQDSQLTTIELIVFTEFIIYSVKNELISMFKIEMPVLKKEFIKYISTCSSHGLTLLMKDPTNVDPASILQDIDDNIIKNFFVEAKIQGWLKEYKDDYEELLHSSTASTQSTLRTELAPEEDPKGKILMERIFKL